jgi:AcrR family transcriptional regulator
MMDIISAMDTRRDRKEETHRRIVETASRAIRGSGFHGVGVADIMKRAGLTHGGFYAHFPSRDALLAEALQHAGRESRARIVEAGKAGVSRKHSPFRAFVESYLSDRHLEAVEGGCPVAALVGEAPRQAAEVRASAVEGVHALVASVEAALPERHRADAGAVAGQLVGSLQLARALGVKAESRSLLAATRASLLERYDTSG